MKKLVFSLIAVLSFNVFAHAELAEAGWKKLDTVCIKSGYDADLAKKQCEFSAQVVNLISTDEVTFQASCRAANLEDDQCRFGYWLHSKLIILDQALH